MAVREMLSSLDGVLRGRWRAYTSLACLLIAVGTQSWFFSYGYRLTADDAEAYYYALGPLKDALAYAHHMAVISGRIGHYIAVPANITAAYLSDFLLARIVFAFIFFGSFVAFSALISTLLRKENLFAPLSLLYILCAPLLFNHTPPTAYPVQITLPFLAILLSRIYWCHAENSNLFSPVRAVFLVALIMGSEYTLLFTAGVLVAEYAIRWMNQSASVFRSKLFRTDCAGVALALAVYSMRFLMPVDYAGNQPDGAGDPISVLTLLWLQTWNGTIFSRLGLVAIIPPPGVLYATITFACVCAIAVLFSPRFAPTSGRKIVWAAAASLFIAWLIVMMPPAANKRLQDWCFINNDCTYTTSRMAYYFFIPAVFLPVIAFTNRIVSASIIAAVAFAGFPYNWAVSEGQRVYVQPYVNASRYACSRSEQDQKISIDPNATISMHAWMDRSDYWSRIVNLERGRQHC